MKKTIFTNTTEITCSFDCPECGEDVSVRLQDLRYEDNYFCGDFTGTDLWLDATCQSCGTGVEVHIDKISNFD